MNPRIRELMIQAGYVAPELAGRAHHLAELLVKECVDVACNYDKPNLSGPGLAIACNIEAHFDIYTEEDGRFVK